MKNVRQGKLSRFAVAIVLSIAMLLTMLPVNMLVVQAKEVEDNKTETSVIEDMDEDNSADEADTEVSIEQVAEPMEEDAGEAAVESVEEDSEVSEGETEDDFLVGTSIDIVDSGTCGENLTWTLDSEGMLTISGTGEMDDYESSTIPWH